MFGWVWMLLCDVGMLGGAICFFGSVLWWYTAPNREAWRLSRQRGRHLLQAQLEDNELWHRTELADFDRRLGIASEPERQREPSVHPSKPPPTKIPSSGQRHSA